MMRPSRVFATGNIVTAGIVSGMALIGAGVASGEETPPPAPTLDPRIAPEKVGEREVARLPEEVVLPLPATHRIATDSSQVPIGPAS